MTAADSPSAVELARDLLLSLWPLWVLAGAIVLARLVHLIYRWRSLSRSGIDEIDRMSGPEFERYLGTMSRRLGYRVEQVGSARGDFGCDLIARKDGRRIAVQAKRWRGRVGIKAVQEAAAAKALYDCTEATVVTNSRFTWQARKLAAANHVDLCDRDDLVKRLMNARAPKRVPDEEDAPAQRLATLSGAERAKDGQEVSGPRAYCARCGRTVSEKVRAYCLAHSERFGGLVYCYEHQRGFRRAEL